MKKAISFFAICAMLCMLTTQTATASRTWRVNILSNYNGSTLYGENMGGTSDNPVFSQLTQPNTLNTVQNGDTLHLEGAVDTYDPVVLVKKLTIIGAGYYLPDNPNTSNNLLETKLSYITLSSTANSSSQGSQLIGVHVTSSNGISISNISDITIKRCRIDYDIYVGYANSGIRILQNFFANTTSTASAISISSNGFPADFIFNNNICQRTLLLFNGANVYVADQCKNNVFDCPALTGGSPSIKLFCNSFLNNILKTTAATVEINNNVQGSNVDYNISASAAGQFGTTLNNLVVTNQSTLFISSLSPDGRYQLLAGSQGIANGSDGGDRGAFGGIAPQNKYTLSGLGPIPVIYDIRTSGIADATGLPVTIKARTIK